MLGALFRPGKRVSASFLEWVFFHPKIVGLLSGAFIGVYLSITYRTSDRVLKEAQEEVVESLVESLESSIRSPEMVQVRRSSGSVLEVGEEEEESIVRRSDNSTNTNSSNSSSKREEMKEEVRSTSVPPLLKDEESKPEESSDGCPTSDVGCSSIGCEEEDDVGRSTVEEGSSSQCSDSGRGSEVDGEMMPSGGDDDFFAYHFYVPSRLCGRFIGSKGSNIKTLKTLSKCHIVLKDLYGSSLSEPKNLRSKKPPHPSNTPPQLCIIEGKRSAIQKCMELIQSKFPLAHDFTMEQVNLPSDTLWSNGGSPGLSLASETTAGASVCAIVSPAHVFLQLPSHPSHASLEELNDCMSKCYETLDTPMLLRPIEPGVVCVARTSPSEDTWWRVQVVSYDDNMDICDIKFLDYGGFLTVHASQLRQIRTDYLSLPFQAIEVYLANLTPPKSQLEWPLDSGSQMEELLFYKNAKVNLLGVAEDGIPLVHLYTSCDDEDNDDEGNDEDQPLGDEKEINVNRELVERGIASWVELVPMDKEEERESETKSEDAAAVV